MRKVLITGGTGFVGANFVYTFLERGDEVHLLVRPESKLWRIEPVKNRIKLHTVDLTKEKKVEEFISQLKPDIILHFATYGAYQGKEQDIKVTIDTNLLGTINLVNACSKIPFDCFINTGSNSEYGTKEKPMREDNLLEPNNLYGVTKAAATLYCDFFAKKMDLPLVTMRPFAVYGYFEERERFIPAIINASLTHSQPHLISPHAVRDFVFIEDVIGAYLSAIKHIKTIKGNVFNIGTGVQYTLSEVVNTLNEITDFKLDPIYGVTKPKQYEPPQWVADITKSKKLLQWAPADSLKGGLTKTVEWFKKNAELYSR